MPTVTLRSSGEHAIAAVGHAQPEVLLAAEVIRRALEDGCAVPPADMHRRSATRSNADGSSAGPAERVSAWCFLTDPSGAWAASRRGWCEIAGVEESALRAAALKRGMHPAAAEHEEKARLQRERDQQKREEQQQREQRKRERQQEHERIAA